MSILLLRLSLELDENTDIPYVPDFIQRLGTWSTTQGILVDAVLEKADSDQYAFELANTMPSGSAGPTPVFFTRMHPYTAMASSTYNYSAYPASNVIDGDNSSNSSRWLASPNEGLSMLTLHFDEHFTPSEIKLWTGYNGYNSPLADIVVLYWNGVEYVPVHTISNNTSGSVVIPLHVDFPTTRIRFEFPTGWPKIYEVEVYGAPVHSGGGGFSQLQ